MAGGKVCSVCSKDGASKRCSKCLCRQYCGRECQVADWSSHKGACEGMARENFSRLLLGMCGSYPDPRFWCEEVLDALARPPHELPPPLTWAEVGDLKTMITPRRQKTQQVNEVSYCHGASDEGKPLLTMPTREGRMCHIFINLYVCNGVLQIYFMMTSMFALRARHKGTSESRAAVAKEMEQALDGSTGLGTGLTFADPGVICACIEYAALLDAMDQHDKAARFARKVRAREPSTAGAGERMLPRRRRQAVSFPRLSASVPHC